jgi:hypothetical protein
LVAATGPSLTPEVAASVKGCNIVAVNDAWRLLPFAQVLYACDASWWTVHKGASGFAGERWSSHGAAGRIRHNDKALVAAKYRLNLVEGRDGSTFSTDPGFIHYGSNSGFQAVNLALLMGAIRIVLVGFDMQAVDGRKHFFGDHCAGLRNTSNYRNFIQAFERAAKALPAGLEILNATPGSALRCFPMVDLHDALPLAA